MTKQLPETIPNAEGRRERKQRETRRRIAEVGLQLFLSNGYDTTTLDQIANAAGISRRSFFSYFKSKDDLVLAWQDEGWASMWAELATVSSERTPLDAVQEVLVKHASRYEAEEMQAIDRVMRASETLLARKPAVYLKQEEAMYETLRQVWTDPVRYPGLRVLAMASVGALRLTIDAWSKQTGSRSTASFLEEAFANLRTAFQATSPPDESEDSNEGDGGE